MSEENVEAVSRAITAFNERSVEGLMAVCDPNVEFRPLLAGVKNAPYRGEEGVREWLAATDEAFERFHLRAERIEDHGDFVLVVGVGEARGRASGAEIERPLVQISRFESGKIVWWQTFRSAAEALKAAGLSE